MLPASLAACVPVFIATPTSACGERGRVVGAVAGHRDHRAADLLALDQRHLVFGRGLGEEVVDAGLGRDRRRGARVVAGDHDRADAHRAHLVEALAHALLHDVLEVDDAEDAACRSATTSGVPPLRRDAVDDRLELVGDGAALLLDPPPHRVGRALADRAPLEVDAAHAGLRGERRRAPRPGCRAARGRSAPRRTSRSSGLRASRRPGSRAARRRPASRSSTPGTGEELGGLAVAVGDRAGLVEQQRRAVARRFDRPAAHREHVALHEPVHARDADRREQRADRRRDQAHEQRDEHGDRLAAPSSRSRTAAA